MVRVQGARRTHTCSSCSRQKCRRTFGPCRAVECAVSAFSLRRGGLTGGERRPTMWTGHVMRARVTGEVKKQFLFVIFLPAPPASRAKSARRTNILRNVPTLGRAPAAASQLCLPAGKSTGVVPSAPFLPRAKGARAVQPVHRVAGLSVTRIAVAGKRNGERRAAAAHGAADAVAVAASITNTQGIFEGRRAPPLDCGSVTEPPPPPPASAAQKH